MDFEENPSNGSRDTAQEEMCSPSKFPFIIERLSPNLQYSMHMRGDGQVWSLSEVLFSPGKVPFCIERTERNLKYL